jgi:hypothetical protein
VLRVEVRGFHAGTGVERAGCRRGLWIARAVDRDPGRRCLPADRPSEAASRRRSWSSVRTGSGTLSTSSRRIRATSVGIACSRSNDSSWFGGLAIDPDGLRSLVRRPKRPLERRNERRPVTYAGPGGRVHRKSAFLDSRALGVRLRGIR